MKKLFSLICISGSALAVSMMLSSCATVGEVGAAVGQASGVITSNEAQSIVRTSRALGKTFEDITPEQEYYIGRAVGASVLKQYGPYENQAAEQYVNVLGQTLAVFSEKPETYGGYHFLMLDSDEINAFAAPGGLIFVTRGMLRLCSNEADLAAVLAHEIAHVENNHGLRAIKKGRLTSALTILAAESAKQFGSEELAELTEAFESSISDITSTMMNSGYARKLEREADQSAIRILGRVGYDPAGLTRVLERMDRALKPGGLDFAKTHPDPEKRIADLKKAATAAVPSSGQDVRIQRFTRAMKDI